MSVLVGVSGSGPLTLAADVADVCDRWTRGAGAGAECGICVVLAVLSDTNAAFGAGGLGESGVVGSAVCWSGVGVSVRVGVVTGCTSSGATGLGPGWAEGSCAAPDLGSETGSSDRDGGSLEADSGTAASGGASVSGLVGLAVSESGAGTSTRDLLEACAR